MRYIRRIVKYVIIVAGALRLALTTTETVAEDYPLWFLVMAFLILGIAFPLILEIAAAFTRAMHRVGLVYEPVYRITEKANSVTYDWFSKIFILGGVLTPILCLAIVESTAIACIVAGIGLVGDGVVLSASRKRSLKSLTPLPLLHM